MKNRFRIFFRMFLFLLTVIGCFGCQSPNSQTKEIDFSQMTYVALGDSITYGADNSLGYLPMEFPYCELVKEELGLKKVINYGANGTYLTDYKEDGSAMVIRYKEMEDQADIVSVLGGINDFCEGDGKQTSVSLGTIEDRNPKSIYGALNLLAEGLKEKYPQAFIFFMTPMTVTPPHYPPVISYSLERLVQAMIEVAEKQNLPVLDLYRDCPFEEEMSKENSDGIHPSQEFVKNELAPLISEFIRKNYNATKKAD